MDDLKILSSLKKFIVLLFNVNIVFPAQSRSYPQNENHQLFAQDSLNLFELIFYLKIHFNCVT